MPLFEYRCLSCDAEHEAFVPVEKRNDARSCPRCNEPATRTMTRHLGLRMGLPVNRGQRR